MFKPGSRIANSHDGIAGNLTLSLATRGVMLALSRFGVFFATPALKTPFCSDTALE